MSLRSNTRVIDLSTYPQKLIDSLIELIDFFGTVRTGISSGIALA